MPTRSRPFAMTGFALTAALGGCTDDGPTAPTADAPLAALEASRSAPRVTFMTRNIYVGADLDAVIAALVSPAGDDDLPSLLTAVETLRRTDFAARARALAREIDRASPHVVGLQEVSAIDVDLRALGLPVELHLDFLSVLREALAERGLSYTVAASIRNIDATPMPGIRLQDFDVMLVDPARVSVGASQGRLFSTNIGPVAPGVALTRGFVRIEAVIDGIPLTVASAHLEPGGTPGLDQLRAAQALELSAAVASASRAVVMGDLNDLPGSLMHDAMLAGGFTDVWAALRPRASGHTCCHEPDLSNPTAAGFDQRIDYVMARGLGHRRRPVVGAVTRVGHNPSVRAVGPDGRIWPSDHAGLVAALALSRQGPLP